MNIIVDNTFLIVSKCEKLIAKGTPRNRYICHVDENDKKRFLTYSSEGRAKSAYRDCGFYLSGKTTQYIQEEYPQLVKRDGWVAWQDIQSIFETREVQVSYKTI